MDPEKQPLLTPASQACRSRRFRPLTSEEVLYIRHEVTWRRTRFFLNLMFWAIMAMFLSIVTLIIITAPKCNSNNVGFGPAPFVPPVHLSFAPLISSGRTANDDNNYL